MSLANDYSEPGALAAMMAKTLREDAKGSVVSKVCFDKVHLTCGDVDCGCECHREEAKHASDPIGTQDQELIRELVEALKTALRSAKDHKHKYHGPMTCDRCVALEPSQVTLSRAQDAGYG